ncbi:MAG: hypothetical protein GC206_17045 [Alphaproteobacteria bacterium]|nr:hypothetical protein [Alphaproteobacteria bacterium]
MYFRIRPTVFEPAALADLQACADELIARARTHRASLGSYLPDASARVLITAAVRRFYASELPALFAERFGKRPALSLGITTIRYQAPDAPANRVEWHLDLNFVYDDSPFMVAWVPLEDVGTTRIGLEVCAPTRPVAPAALFTPWLQRIRSGRTPVFTDGEVEAIFGADGFQARSLSLSAGGAAVFDQFVLHRSQDLTTATEPRRSFEFRMMDLDALSDWARRTDGLFCREAEGSPDGIEFLVKAGGTLRVAAGPELDGLEVSGSS